MIRILHFADLHLGVETYGRMDPATGLNTRFLDFLARLDEVVDFALGNDVDLALFCGDAYKNRDPSQTQQREFAKRLARLAAAGIPIFLLVGNHDLPNALGRATAVDIFDTLQVAHITVASKAGRYLVQTKKGPVQVVALPWPRRNSLLSQEATKNLSLNEIDKALQSKLVDILKASFEQIDSAMPAILTAHISLSEAKWSSEKSTLLGREPFLLMSNLLHPSLDYTALGHIHCQQVLGRDASPIVYSGSLERLDFSEADEEKGFYVADLEPARRAGGRLVKLDFQRVAARRLLTIPVRLNPDDTDPTATVLHAVERWGGEIKDAVVRIQVSLQAHQQSRLNDAYIRRALKEAYFPLPLALDVQRQGRGRLTLGTVEGKPPLALFQDYLQIKGVSTHRAQKLLEYATRLVEPEAGEQPAAQSQ